MLGVSGARPIETQSAGKAETEIHRAVCDRLAADGALGVVQRRRAESGLPQDGLIRIRVAGLKVDLRMATVPALNREGAVLRILDRSELTLDFDGLGFDAPLQAALGRLVAEIETGRLARHLGPLLETGVALSQALRLAGAALTNCAFRAELTGLCRRRRQSAAA